MGFHAPSRAWPEHLPQELIDDLYSKSWVVYAKRPFKNVSTVIEYLGRYSHKIAISNHRLQNISDGQVVFSYKDYKDEGKNKSITLDAARICQALFPSYPSERIYPD